MYLTCMHAMNEEFEVEASKCGVWQYLLDVETIVEFVNQMVVDGMILALLVDHYKNMHGFLCLLHQNYQF